MPVLDGVQYPSRRPIRSCKRMYLNCRPSHRLPQMALFCLLHLLTWRSRRIIQAGGLTTPSAMSSPFLIRGKASWALIVRVGYLSRSDLQLWLAEAALRLFVCMFPELSPTTVTRSPRMTYYPYWMHIVGPLTKYSCS